MKKYENIKENVMSLCDCLLSASFPKESKIAVKKKYINCFDCKIDDHHHLRIFGYEIVFFNDECFDKRFPNNPRGFAFFVSDIKKLNHDFANICELETVKEFAKKIKCGNITATIDIKDNKFVKIRWANVINEFIEN